LVWRCSSRNNWGNCLRTLARALHTPTADLAGVVTAVVEMGGADEAAAARVAAVEEDPEEVTGVAKAEVA
jgi:hypothetical protein